MSETNTPRVPPARSKLHENATLPDPDFDDDGDGLEKIQKGMPGRNIKAIATLILGLIVASFLLWPQSKKTPKEEPQVQIQTPAKAENLVAELVRESKKPDPEPAPILPPPFQPYPPANLTEPSKNEGVDERLLESLVASTATSGVELKSKNVGVSSKPANDILSLMEAQQTKNDLALKDAEEFARRMLQESAEPGALAVQNQRPQAPSHTAFLEKQSANATAPFGQALGLQNARSSNALYEGTLVRTVLTRALKTDLPGTVTAKVTTDLYDTVSQRILLVPRGSEITCSYQSEVMVGQELVLMACSRLRLPNGKSFNLAAASASDVQGASGLPAEINNHFWKIFKNALVVGAVSALLPSDDRKISSIAGETGVTTAGTILGTTLSKVVDVTLNRNISIPPTGYAPIGTPFTLTLSRDVELEPYLR
jgi:type IV secretion system protein VirB10